MTGHEVYVLLSNITDDLIDIIGERIKFVENELPGVGWTHDVPGDTLEFAIGVAGLKDCCDELSDHEAMLSIVGLFHEVCGHGGQVMYEFDKQTDLSRILATNYYACKGSGEYYDGCAVSGEFTKQYASQPYEIAAQYAGLRSARTYLSDCFGLKRADEMLLDYVNHRIEIGSEFITGGPYDDMDDVLDEFDKTFVRSADRHHVYRPDTPDKFDSLHACVPKIGAQKAVFVINCRSGLKQDFMMAAAYRAVHPRNEEQFNRPVFDDIDMSLENAFSRFSKWLKPNVRRSSLDQMLDLISDEDGPDASNGPELGG